MADLTQAASDQLPVVSANEDRQRMLRDRLMRARDEADRSAESSNGRRSAAPIRQIDEEPRYPRRPSPTYESIRNGDRLPPGPPPRREEYGRYRPSHHDDCNQRPPPPQRPPHWDQLHPQDSNRSYYDERDDRGTAIRPFHDDTNGAPPPGVWGRRGPREDGQHGEPLAMPRYQPGGLSGDHNANAGDFFSSRNAERSRSTLSIWPPSPKSPYQSDVDDGRRRSKKSKSKSKHASRSKDHKSSRHRDHSSRKRRHEVSDDASQDSEEEERRRRRRRKEKERRRDIAGSEHRVSDKKQYSSRSRGHKNSEEVEKSDRERRRRSTSRSDRPRSVERRHDHRISRRSPCKSSSSSSEDDDENIPTISSRPDGRPDGFQMSGASKADKAAASDDEDIGPKLPMTADGRVVDPRAYGGALLPGEGSAMAAFLQDGKRIPRRGEIGLSSDQIEDYEKVGYVMSGSRHARMNAVRMRKENQVISAEEKRTLLKMRNEEKEKKEREIVGQFREMLDTMQPGGH